MQMKRLYLGLLVVAALVVQTAGGSWTCGGCVRSAAAVECGQTMACDETEALSAACCCAIKQAASEQAPTLSPAADKLAQQIAFLQRVTSAFATVQNADPIAFQPAAARPTGPARYLLYASFLI